MIVMRIELWPGGDKTRAKHIASARIHNVSALADVSDYEFAIEARGSRFASPFSRGGKIVGHDRRQGVWALVQAMLKATGLREAPSDTEESPGKVDTPPNRSASALHVLGRVGSARADTGVGSQNASVASRHAHQHGEEASTCPDQSRVAGLPK